MKVLLISENRTTTLVAPFPVGLAFVTGALRRAGHDVVVLDLMFLPEWEEPLQTCLKEFAPDVIGLSVRNIDNQDLRNPVFYLDNHIDIIKICRGLSGAPVILGGAGFNIHPAGCLEYINADFGIYGEGEEAFPMLLASIGGRTFEHVPGLVWRKDKRVIVNAPQQIADPEQWSYPSFSDFDITSYHEAGTELPGCITVQQKRGCHMKCIYCSTPLLEGTHSRSRDLKRAVSDIALLHREKNISRFYIADNVFNYPLSAAKDFCREVISQNLEINWQAIVNPAFGDKELFALMGGAGCSFIALGNESGHELILKNLRKGFTLTHIKETARLARDNGIRYGCFLLLGGPGESRDTVKQSIEFVEGLNPTLVTLKAGIRIYPGTKLEEIARRQGMIEHNQDLLLPAFYLSPEIREWVWDYLDEVISGRKNWKV